MEHISNTCTAPSIVIQTTKTYCCIYYYILTLLLTVYWMFLGYNIFQEAVTLQFVLQILYKEKCLLYAYIYNAVY